MLIRTFRIGNVSLEIYRVGDIVELSVSFVVWPCSRGKARMIIQLRSMRLLDNEETNVSHYNILHIIRVLLLRIFLSFFKNLQNARLKAMRESNRRHTEGKLAVPKRKKTYTKEEEIAEAQFKLSKMRIDETLMQVEPLQFGGTIR